MNVLVESQVLRSFLSVAICAGRVPHVYPAGSNGSPKRPWLLLVLSRRRLAVRYPSPVDGAVAAHATLVVLRTLGPDIASGSRIRLDYEALPEGVSHISGPDVPPLTPGTVFAIIRALAIDCRWGRAARNPRNTSHAAFCWSSAQSMGVPTQ
jgi:hypothetical protein